MEPATSVSKIEFTDIWTHLKIALYIYYFTKWDAPYLNALPTHYFKFQLVRRYFYANLQSKDEIN